MKPFFTFLLATTAVLPTLSAFSPQPASVTPTGGDFSYTSGTRLFYETRTTTRPIEDTLQPLAEVLSSELEAITGIRPAVLAQAGGISPGPGDISLEFDPISGSFAASEEDEDQSYILNVTDSVTIRSQYFKGVAYGTTTLLQALVENAGYTVPKMAIADAPAAAYRTVMIDLARQPSSLGTVKEVVRLARQYKLRYLHLHLTDDQNFTFPFTPVTSALAGNFTYPRAALEDLAAYADARGVTIIPELDLPGHSSKLRASGYLNPSANDADVAHPDNYAKIQAIIDDMLLVFPNTPYFHIGGDESGAGGALVPFLEAMNIHLRGKTAGLRKRLLVWEGFHGSPTAQLPATGPDRIVVVSWESSYNTPWNLLNSGYQVVNASWKPLYLVGSGATSRQPHTAQRMWPPEVLHTWDKDTFMHWQPGRPVFEDLGPADPDTDDGVWNAAWIGKQSQVLGGQMLSWEQNEKTIVRDLLPRLPVMADRLWNPVSAEDYAAFSARLEAVRERALTIVRPVEILPFGPVPETPLAQDYRLYPGQDVTIVLRNRTRIPGTIRYETGAFNNSRTSANFELVPETTSTSPGYSAPFIRSGGFGIRAQLYRADDGTAIDGHDWAHFNNWENLVRVTEYEVPRRPLTSVPDFASFTNDKITQVYDLPVMRGPYVVEQVRGQMFRAILQVPGSGTYDLSMQTSDGRASVYLDLDRDGNWEASEKLIADSPANDIAVHTNVPLTQGDYDLRVDHASGAIGPIVWLKINGPGTGGNKDVTEYLRLPVDPDAPPSVPQHVSPGNGATGVPPTPSLQWSAAGVDTYNLFLWVDGTAKPATPTATGLTTPAYQPATLALGTTYRWTVVAHNANGSAEGSEAIFTTSDTAGPGPAIGWNYLGLGGVGLNANARAGAPGFEQDHWNNHAGSGQGPGTVPFTLVDSSGVATTAQVTGWTLSANNSWQYGSTSTPDHALMNDFTDKEPSITFSGIPYSGYNVVVYYGNNEGPSTSTLKVGSQSRTITTGNTIQASFGAVGYLEGTAANTTSPTNFSAFSGLSATNLTVSLTGGNNNGICAIQIIEGEPVPESTTPAVPSFPPDGAGGSKPWQPLCWIPGGAGEVGYDLYLWQDGTPKPETPAANVATPEFFPSAYLAANQLYRWQVVTRLQSGATLTSNEFSFTTGDLVGQPPFDISAAGQAARTAANDALMGLQDLVTNPGGGYPVPDRTTLAFYGDSITDVFTYFDVLQSALQAARTADPSFPEITVLNRGINGATTDDLLHLPDGDQFSGGSGPNPPRPFKQQVDADLAALPPGGLYLAVLQIGINDVLQGDRTPKAVYKARLEEMTDYVLGKGHLVVLLSHTVINESPIADIVDDGLFDDAGNTLLNQYVEAQREIATARAIPFVNQREAYLNVYRNENIAVAKDASGTLTFPFTTGILNVDSVHPTPRGKNLSSEFAARGIFEAVRNLGPPGEIDTTPVSVTFPGQNIGTSSDARTVTIRNLDGSNSLHVSEVGTGGPHAGDFALGGSTGGIIPPGAQLLVQVTFTPTGAGARSAGLVVSSNDADEGTVTIPLGGTGLAVPPATPANPSPTDGASGLPPNTGLNWGDAAGATSYDVFLWRNGGTMPASPSASVTSSEYTPARLDGDTSYLWTIVSRNAAGTASGPAWSFATAPASDPASIGWNYRGVGGVGLASADLAGAPGFEQDSWNNHAGAGQGPGSVPFALRDNSASATTSQVTAWTLSTNNSWQHNQVATPDEILLNDFSDTQPSITFSSIPYDHYDLVVYYGNNEGPSTSTLSVTGGLGDARSRTITTGNTSLSSHRAVGYLEGTDANTSSPTNFTLFTGLNDPATTVSLSGANNNGISAIQIVESTPPLSGFALWQSTTPGAGSGFDSNTDRDPWIDLVEYALGGDPATGIAPPGLPVVHAPTEAIGLSYRRPTGITDVLYELQGSTNAITWFAITDLTPGITPGPGTETVLYSNLRSTRDLPGVDTSPKALFRLRFTLL